MKKILLLALVVGMGTLFSGCAAAFLVNRDGFPCAAPGILITEMSSAAVVEKKVLPANYKVLGPVEAQAKTVNYVGLFAFGDSSFKALKRQALERYPGAKDIINLEVDASHKNILCLVNEVTSVLRGIAITY